MSNRCLPDVRIDRTVVIGAESDLVRRRLRETRIDARAPIGLGQYGRRSRHDLELQRVRVREGDALRDPGVLTDRHGTRLRARIQRLRVDAGCVDDERLALPTPDRSAGVRRDELHRQCPAVGVDAPDQSHLVRESDAARREQELDGLHESAARARELHRPAITPQVEVRASVARRDDLGLQRRRVTAPLVGQRHAMPPPTAPVGQALRRRARLRRNRGTRDERRASKTDA